MLMFNAKSFCLAQKPSNGLIFVIGILIRDVRKMQKFEPLLRWLNCLNNEESIYIKG